MRDIKELLEMLLVSVNTWGVDGNGLCWVVTGMNRDRRISYDERCRLRKYINDNAPVGCVGGEFYWIPNLIPPRVKWLKDHIKLNTKSLSNER